MMDTTAAKCQQPRYSTRKRAIAEGIYRTVTTVRRGGNGHEWHMLQKKEESGQARGRRRGRVPALVVLGGGYARGSAQSMLFVP